MCEVSYDRSQILFEAGQPVTHVLFPATGLISMIVTDREGSSVEVAVIGNEGVAGLGGLLSAGASFLRQVIQLPTRGIRIGRNAFLSSVNKSPRLRALLAQYTAAFTLHLMQTSACNACHNADQRLARWILLVADRSGLTSLPFTQDAMAELVGVRRPTVTLAIRGMQAAGLVEHRRGVLAIIDRAGLEQIACECYGIIRSAYDNTFCAPTACGCDMPVRNFS